jgi:5-methylcytosine-specific restriction endonuclease McrA
VYDMVRTIAANIVKLCKECKVKPAPYGQTRCIECQRKWRSDGMRKRRALNRDDLIKENSKLRKRGKRICSICRKLRVLSEFSTSQPKRKGKLNKICDACLTSRYVKRGEHSGINENFWRRRAYSVNSATRQRLARIRRLPLSALDLTDLAYEVKPQDLAQMFEKQHLCSYCGIELTANNMTVDHIIPWSRDGGQQLSNLCLCCKPCNLLKFTMTAEEFRYFLRGYAQLINKAIERWDKEPVG